WVAPSKGTDRLCSRSPGASGCAIIPELAGSSALSSAGPEEVALKTNTGSRILITIIVVALIVALFKSNILSGFGVSVQPISYQQFLKWVDKEPVSIEQGPFKQHPLLSAP